jgi:signal transduction histidine kinase/CheY-like chemotaxis protein
LSLELATPISPGFEALVFKASRGIEDIYELTYIRKDGSRFPAVVSVTALRDAHGAIVGYLLIGTDNTARKRAEEEKEKLEDQNRQLQKSESLGRMAGAIAHHFNNQLQAVMMNLELAMNHLPRNAPFAGNLANAMESARKAAEVSTQMLTYIGQPHGKREPTDLSEACLRSLPMLRTTAPKSVMFETELPSPGPVASAHYNQIQQILTNLVTNAWEACRGGRGAIRLTIKTVSAADIPATNRFPVEFQPQGNAYACLEVADEGCGILPQDIERLFEPFFSTKFTGRGLGLSVVLGIVRAHEGVVKVESKPGSGSFFRVFLPLSTEAIPPKAVPVVQAPDSTGGGMVLVVDDERLVREAHKTAMEAMGFTVLIARDGVEAVEVFGRHKDEIRLVLSDLSMPRMNGWETLSVLRKLAPDIPVILCSGYSKDQAMEGDHPDLPQAFLSKPCTSDEFRKAIFQVLARKAGEVTNA